MSRLYRIEWSGCCYVFADSAEEAIDLANDEVTDANAIGLDCDVAPGEVKLEDVDFDWRESIPLGEQHDRTVEQILKGSK